MTNTLEDLKPCPIQKAIHTLEGYNLNGLHSALIEDLKNTRRAEPLPEDKARALEALDAMDRMCITGIFDEQRALLRAALTAPAVDVDYNRMLTEYAMREHSFNNPDNDKQRVAVLFASCWTDHLISKGHLQPTPAVDDNAVREALQNNEKVKELHETLTSSQHSFTSEQADEMLNAVFRKFVCDPYMNQVVPTPTVDVEELRELVKDIGRELAMALRRHPQDSDGLVKHILDKLDHLQPTTEDE